MTPPKNWDAMNLDQLSFALNDQRRFGRAAYSTVEAVMYELRTHGVAQLSKPNCQRRLSELSNDQVREVIERLHRMRPTYPAITDDLLLTLSGLTNDNKS